MHKKLKAILGSTCTSWTLCYQGTWQRTVPVTISCQGFRLRFDFWKTSVLPKFHEWTQRRIESPVKYLTWEFFQKWLTTLIKSSILAVWLGSKSASLVSKVPVLGTRAQLQTHLSIYLQELYVTGVIFFTFTTPQSYTNPILP